MNSVKETREAVQHLDVVQSCLTEQDEQIQAQTKTIHHLASQIVKAHLAIGAALAALQSGQKLDVVAAIDILRRA